MAFRTVTILGLVSGAASNHLAGPMQDRMNACMAEKCPDFNAFNTAPNFNGMGISFAQFTAPFMNFNQFGFNMPYVLDVMGYTTNNFTYVDTCVAAPDKPDWCTLAANATPVVKTASAQQNMTDSFACACQHCGASLEAIFQPAGRAVCSMVGFPLPCQTEFDTCKNDPANSGSVTSTGSLATKDLVYPAIMTNTASTDPCHPEASLFGYKVAYNLTEDCATSATTLAGSASALSLAACVANSRLGAYPSNLNCLDDVGGATCGSPAPACTPPTCTSGATYGCTPAPADQGSGAATATVAAAALALSAAAL